MVESKSTALPTWRYPNGIKLKLKLIKIAVIGKKKAEMHSMREVFYGYPGIPVNQYTWIQVLYLDSGINRLR